MHGTPFQCCFHRPKQICREESPLPKKWLTTTDSANGPKVLLVPISKVGCNFWLVVIGMSLCRVRAPHSAKQIRCRKWYRWPWLSCSSHLGPSATRIKNGLVGLKIHVQKSAGVNMHSSQWGDSPRFTPVSLLRIDMQAPRLALLPREKPGQWDSSQTCRDQDSLRTGQVTCLPTCLEGHHNHTGVWCGNYLFSKITGEKWSRTT